MSGTTTDRGPLLPSFYTSDKAAFRKGRNTNMNVKNKILFIENNRKIFSVFSNHLNKNGYRVIWAQTGSEGLSLAASLCPDIVLLDLKLPDMDGYQVLTKLHNLSHIPVIVTSSPVQEEYKVLAWDLGADDFIIQPVGTSELMARIRTSLRRSHAIAPVVMYRSLQLEIDFDGHIVRLDGLIVHLTQIEYQILALLARNSGKVLDYHKIITKIWGPYASSNNQILRVNMANIRRKIEKDPARPQYVFTEAGIGYRMRENEFS